MGPDEFATREELGLVVKLLFAKVRQQAETISLLAGKLIASGALTASQFEDLLSQLKTSKNSTRADECLRKLKEYGDVRETIHRYENLEDQAPE